MKKRIRTKKLLSLVATSAIAITSLFGGYQNVFAWSCDDAFNQDYSTHLFIVNGGVKLISSNTDSVINKPSTLLEQFRDRWEQGLYDADHLNPFYDSGTFMSHFYDPDTQTNYAGLSYPTARQSGSKYFNIASDYYKHGDFSNAFYYLGVSLHYFTDATMPLHASNISNLDHNAPGYHSKLESYSESIQNQAPVPDSGLFNWVSSTDPELWVHQAAVQAKSVMPQVWNDSITSWFWQAAVSNYYSDMWKNAVKTPILNQLSQAERETAGFIDMFFRSNGVDLPVTIYSGTAFGGASEILGSGNYNYEQLVKGIGNDTISSIRIAPGYQVTLFADSNYSGVSTVVTGDVYGLGNLNHQTSSMKVETIPTNPAPSPMMQAESFSGSKGILTHRAGTGTVVGNMNTGSWLSYDNVDFGTGKTKFIASVGMDPVFATIGKQFELRLDSPTGTLIGTFTINSTGGWDTYATQTSSVSGASGSHKLYIVAKDSGDGFGNIDWFTFSS
ncbi:hypothetical protein J2Z65_004252 [Paenibacillus aceris]|uniref:Phospholipase C n=2 Tax=Paenibacillus aceris TaxID=869555 RepID=A0ABS4I4F3_9BACL|nr:carbohydrate-binding protein [Paenibacillus aceris]MBP1965019.1 hypothetical protein [Paenibacillus aceris]